MRGNPERSALVIVRARSGSDAEGTTAGEESGLRLPVIEGWGLEVLQVDQAGGRAPLSAAVRNGLRAARPDAIILVDAELLESDTLIREALRKIDGGACVILGSRTIEGGALAVRQGRGRKFLSRLESFLVRAALFFPIRLWFRVTDPLSGFLAFGTEGLDGGLFEDLREAIGKTSTLAVMYTLIRGNANVVEVPVGGEDSFKGLERALSVFRSAVRLRLRRPETGRFLKFCAVGFSGYVINASALELFRNMSFTRGIARVATTLPTLSRYAPLASRSAWAAALAAELAIVSNYLLNNFWTFSENRIRSPLGFLGKLLQFNLTSLGGIVIQFFVVGLATRVAGDTPLVRGIALVLAIVFLVIPYNWTVYNRIIWRVKRRRGGQKGASRA